MLKKKYNQNKETIHSFIWRSLQIFGKQGITFLVFIISAKLLTPYLFGIYNYVLTIIFLLIMFGDFGISTATAKYVAEYNVTCKEKLKAVLFNSGIIILGLTIIITLLTITIGPLYLKDKYIYVLYLLPLIFLVPMTSLYDGIYRGLRKFKRLAIISTIVGVISLSFVYILIKQYGLIGALVAQNLFYLILFLALAFGYREFHFKINKGVMKKILYYSSLVGLANLGHFLYTGIDVIILGHFGLIEEISHYEIVNKIFIMLITPVILLATVVAPEITKDFTLKKYKEIEIRLIKESKRLFIVGLIVAIFSYLILPNFLRLFLPNYNLPLLISILGLLSILIPFRFFSSYINIGYITPGGFAKILTISTLIFGLLNLFLDLYLIAWGLIGIIYATLVSQLLFIGFNMFYFYKILRKLKE
jgi:O-antigen/teichoic acid export membrane protein